MAIDENYNENTRLFFSDFEEFRRKNERLEVEEDDQCFCWKIDDVTFRYDPKHGPWKISIFSVDVGDETFCFVYDSRKRFESKCWGKADEDFVHREDGPAKELADGSKVWSLLGEQVPAYLVLALKNQEQMPDEVFLAMIEEQKNTEVRALMVERYGWQKYLVDSEAKLLDSRDNVIENTKEALFAAGELGNRLVVTCPTGRVFVLGVPKSRKTCEAAQQWLGKASKKINVIGRT